MVKMIIGVAVGVLVGNVIGFFMETIVTQSTWWLKQCRKSYYKRLQALYGEDDEDDE